MNDNKDPQKSWPRYNETTFSSKNHPAATHHRYGESLERNHKNTKQKADIADNLPPNRTENECDHHFFWLLHVRITILRASQMEAHNLKWCFEPLYELGQQASCIDSIEKPIAGSNQKDMSSSQNRCNGFSRAIYHWNVIYLLWISTKPGDLLKVARHLNLKSFLIYKTTRIPVINIFSTTEGQKQQ